tara:strand:+ start:420 stop:1181 length:762 start_codon:yes stop_codon:yes gene_type:complete
VTILVFHEISPSISIKIFKYLDKVYNIISLKEYVEYSSGSADSNLDLIKNKLIITIDDGHRSNFELFNNIKHLKIPFTIFLTTGLIDSSSGFWWKNNSSDYDNESLKKLPDSERIKILSENNFFHGKKLKNREALSSKEIIEMKNIVDFQSHSITHPILTNCDDNKVENEINDSKKFLERYFNFDIYAFAYPNGNWGDREKLISKKCGYKCTLTTIHGYNSLNSDLFELNRISGGTGLSFYESAVKSTGLWNR